MQSQEFYAQHSQYSDPGPHAPAYDALPSDVPSLCEVVQGLLIHVFHASKYGNIVLPQNRMNELQIEQTRGLLDAMLKQDASPLTVARPPEGRLIASCRHYALLLVSMLRHQGVPARIRTGFEAYFHRNNKYGDHWVCEYWNETKSRWVIVDSQLDAVHRDYFNIDFDFTDAPPDKFVLAADMWRACRRGEIDPGLCGILSKWGMDYVRANLVRDVMCLNKVELFPWNNTPLGRKDDSEITNEDVALLERLADMTAPEVQLDDVLAVFKDHPELQPDPAEQWGPIPAAMNG